MTGMCAQLTAGVDVKLANVDVAVERLWALMHQHLTHNKAYPTCREFADAILNFLRDEVPTKMGRVLRFGH